MDIITMFFGGYLLFLLTINTMCFLVMVGRYQPANQETKITPIKSASSDQSQPQRFGKRKQPKRLFEQQDIGTSNEEDDDDKYEYRLSCRECWKQEVLCVQVLSLKESSPIQGLFRQKKNLTAHIRRCHPGKNNVKVGTVKVQEESRKKEKEAAKLSEADTEEEEIHN